MITKAVSMKKSNTIRLTLLALLAGTVSHVFAAPYEPQGRLTSWPQKNADSPIAINLRVFGDEYHSRIETLSGYTVIHRFEDNSYYYAQLSTDGTALVRTNTIATLLPTPEIIARGKHLDIPTNLIFQKTAVLRNQHDSARKLLWDRRLAAFRGGNATPFVGEVVGLTILVSFSDSATNRDASLGLGSNNANPPVLTEAVANNTTLAKVTSFCNTGNDGILTVAPISGLYTANSNVGSVYKYFLDQSGGKLKYVQLVGEVTIGSRASYNFEDPGTNSVAAADARVVGDKILTDAIAALKAQNFNFSPLTADTDGRILATNLIVAGLDSGYPMRGIWPHTSSVPAPTENADSNKQIGPPSQPRFISGYHMMMVGVNFNNTPTVAVPAAVSPTSVRYATDQLTIGVFCRENAKMLFGAPDLSAFPNIGVGNQCLMGTGAVGGVANAAVLANLSGSPNPTTGVLTVPQTSAVPAIPATSSLGGRRPAPMNPHFKNLLGWNTVTTVSTTAFSSRVLPTTGNIALRIRKPGSFTESFIIENRGTPDIWIAPPLDTGIAIWHIDDTRNGNIFTEASTQNGVALEQADGLDDLGKYLSDPNNLKEPIPAANHGDANDLFDLGKPLFSSSTTPNSNWFGGQPSSLRVRVAGSALAPNATIEFGFAPNTIEVATPNNGDLAFLKRNLAIRWTANITGNVKIELLKGGVFNLLIAGNERNDGVFDWQIPTSTPFANNYSIRISSLTNAVPTSDLSNGNFSINDGFFPLGGKFPYGWSKPKGSKFAWKVTDSKSFEGRYSLIAEKVGDGQSAGVSYSSNFKQGTIGFYVKVSTEKSSDYLRFYIDNVPQVLSSTNTETRISGEVDWKFFSFPLAAGNHTLRWIYKKDDSFASSTDKVWLDGVTLPETTQEIAVKDPAGVFISDGASTIALPDVGVGLSAAEQSFKIYNLGLADLTRLKISVEGENKDDFIISPPSKNFLKPNKSTTFGVTFSPKAVGLRKAIIRIGSNDTDEGNFAIAVEANGLPAPAIGIYQPITVELTDNKGTLNFGKTSIKSSGKTKTFTIKNNGSAVLTDLEIRKDGKYKGAFVIGSPILTVLAPGESTSFSVNFKPSKKKDGQRAVIHILSNDKRFDKFDIKLRGDGVKKRSNSKEALVSNTKSVSIVESMIDSTFSSGAGGLNSVSPTTTIEVMDGKKYLSLTVTKNEKNGIVEVSPNLIDWYSGPQHTTTLLDNPTTLKVRDNTPITQETKRYIRLR